MAYLLPLVKITENASIGCLQSVLKPNDLASAKNLVFPCNDAYPTHGEIDYIVPHKLKPLRKTKDVIAVPVYRRRVAPVLDFSSKILLLDLNHEREKATTELLWKGLSQSERLDALMRAGVTTVICGGISEQLHALLINSGITVIWGVAGPIDDVSTAYQYDRLGESKFQMPGRRAAYFMYSHRPADPLKDSLPVGVPDDHSVLSKKIQKTRGADKQDITSKEGK